MCGRFTLTADPAELQQTFNLEVVPLAMTPRYNIAPSQPVAIITNLAPRQIEHVRWGLIPAWAKDPAIGSRLINARAETLRDKPSFREAYKRRRCLIPANGFYEWAKDTSGHKMPMYIHLRDHRPFAFAGLWEDWQGPDGEQMRTCTIITTTPNDTVRPLHHRMAVILRPEDYALWLSPDALAPQELAPLLSPYADDGMNAYPVSSAINSPHNEGPSLIAPVAAPQQPPLL